MIEPVLIRRTKDPFGWMGNMSPYPVEWDGIEYRTTEALFQCLRFQSPWSDVLLSTSEEPDDPEKARKAQQRVDARRVIRTLIRCEKSPMSAKMVAKKYKGGMSIQMLGVEDVDHMRWCVYLKVDTYPELGAQLLATGHRPIIEDCTKRQGGSGLFWGAALDPETGEWKGENMLGRLWEEERARLRFPAGWDEPVSAPSLATTVIRNLLDEVFDPNVKRLFMPTIIRSECPECGESVKVDYRGGAEGTHLSDPTYNKEVTVHFQHKPDNGDWHVWTVQAILRPPTMELI